MDKNLKLQSRFFVFVWGWRFYTKGVGIQGRHPPPKESQTFFRSNKEEVCFLTCKNRVDNKACPLWGLVRIKSNNLKT